MWVWEKQGNKGSNREANVMDKIGAARAVQFAIAVWWFVRILMTAADAATDAA